jgi:FkbM family methyltransferase
MIECGASQGLWALPWIIALGNASAKRSLSPGTRHVRALAIEASESQSETRSFWDAQDLRFKASQSGTDLRFTGRNWEFEWIQRAVVAKDGPVFFPQVTVDSDNGAQATDETATRDIRGKEVDYQRVEGVRLGELIARQESLDFLHLDVQGTELDMLLNGEFDALSGRAKVMLLGTHSRAAEYEAFRRLPQLGFTLLAEESCGYSRSDELGRFEGEDQPNELTLTVDGEQLWLSSDAVDEARTAGLIRI